MRREGPDARVNDASAPPDSDNAGSDSVDSDNAGPDDLYAQAAAAYGPALARLARFYERDADKRRDLEQEIHFAVWKSLAGFDGRCALRTWVYRVAHNVAASHVATETRLRLRRAPLEEAGAEPAPGDPEQSAADAQALARLMALVRALETPDRQIMLLYLEDVDAAGIAEITGYSPGAVATRIHRLKHLLAERFHAEATP